MENGLDFECLAEEFAREAALLVIGQEPLWVSNGRMLRQDPFETVVEVDLSHQANSEGVTRARVMCRFFSEGRCSVLLFESDGKKIRLFPVYFRFGTSFREFSTATHSGSRPVSATF